MVKKVFFNLCILVLFAGKMHSAYAQDVEQTFLITDQPYYIAGSDINYAVYLYNPLGDKGKAQSQILHVELLDREGEILVTHKHDVQNGSSPGAFKTEDELSTGWYWIRAYTFYQIDYTEELIHYKPVYIVKHEDLDNIKASDSPGQEIPDLLLYVEGNQVLEDAQNTLVVRSKTGSGTGNPLNAWIIDEVTEDSIGQFTIRPDGTGSCSFPGTQDNKYRLSVSDTERNQRSFQFPPSQRNNCNIRIIDDPSRSDIVIKLYFEPPFTQYKNIEIISKGTSREQRLGRIRVRNRLEEIRINKSDLDPGENIICVTSPEKEILTCKTVLQNKDLGNNLFILKDKLEYIPRQSLIGKIRMTNPMATTFPSSLSVLVRDTRQFQEFFTGRLNMKANSRSSYVGLNYYVENTWLSRKDKNNVANENYILKDLSYHKSLNTIEPKHLPEKAMILKGSIVDSKSGEPLSVRALTFTQTGEFPGYDFQFTDMDGNFEFKDIYFHNRNNELILSVGKTEKIIIDSKQLIPAFNPPGIIGNIWRNKVFLNFIKSRQLENKFSKFYKYAYDTIQYQEPDHYSINKIYDKPDLTYDLDDYIQLNDMREVIIELLPNVKIFKMDDETRIRIYHSSNTAILPDPLFLVNGKLVKDNDYILGMDNTNVKNIDVIVRPGKLSDFGPVANGGIVAIYTREPIDIPFGTKIEMPGFHQPQEVIRYGITDYQISSSMPVFKPVMYWNPALKYESTGETMFDFFTNDLVSEFEVVVQGITPSGEVYFDRKKFLSVKPVIN